MQAIFYFLVFCILLNAVFLWWMIGSLYTKAEKARLKLLKRCEEIEKWRFNILANTSKQISLEELEVILESSFVNLNLKKDGLANFIDNFHVLNSEIYLVQTKKRQSEFLNDITAMISIYARELTTLTINYHSKVAIYNKYLSTFLLKTINKYLVKYPKSIEFLKIDNDKTG